MSDNTKPSLDPLIQSIADYIYETPIESDLAFTTARHCLMDSLGCALLALNYSQCTKLLGPWVQGTQVAHGARVIGTPFVLDPIKAAFDNGMLIRWLDYNDTWLAAEWGHPSDNLGGLLSVMDFVTRQKRLQGQEGFKVKQLLEAMIKAHEIQGVLALENSFNQVGLDHVILVKVATAGLATKLLGGDKAQGCDAISQAFVDGQALRTYRHAPNTGSRKSWAAGDATSRGVQLALMTLKGEHGYPSVLSADKWGFEDVYFRGIPIKINQPLNSYVMENILFKISYPAEFHGQTAVEAAIELHAHVKDNLDNIEKIEIETQQSAMRIINKQGPLHNPADRDHCLQYMVAVGLIFGELTYSSYLEETAQDPRIDPLREKMVLKEESAFSRDYLDPQKRSIANRITVFFKNDQSPQTKEIHYPVGHKNRRKEGIPLLIEKFKRNLLGHYTEETVHTIIEKFEDKKSLNEMSVSDFMALFLKSEKPPAHRGS